MKDYARRAANLATLFMMTVSAALLVGWFA